MAEDYESITESELIRLENGETTSLSTEEQHYIEMKELLWSVEKQLVELNSSLCKMIDGINNIIYKLNDLDKHMVLPEL